jgi:hypothetical protein
MSIIGSFVGALVALAARAKPEKDELLARIDELARERDCFRALAERFDDLAQDRAWRQLGQAAQNVLHQQSQQQQMAACQGLQGAQNALTQRLAQAAESPEAMRAYYQGLQQSQYANMPDGWHCDCSPSRSRAMIGDCPGA